MHKSANTLVKSETDCHQSANDVIFKGCQAERLKSSAIFKTLKWRKSYVIKTIR